MTVESLGLALVTVATIGTAMIIGLGFLHRPSRSALLWSLAFLLALAGSWLMLAGETLPDETVRRLGLGMLLGPPALIWSGFRARRRVPAIPWVGIAQAAVSAGALIVVHDPVWYSLLFRILFFCAAVFAGLTLLEILRSPDRFERLVAPLALVSAAFFVLGVFLLLAGFLFPLGRGDLEFVRVLNAMGMLIYVLCATVSLLFFTSVSPVGVHTATSWPQFTVTATDRLARARAAGETSWTLLAIRIDDPDDIRSAAGETAFTRILQRFEATVQESFPAEADIGREGRGRLVVLISRPGPVIREHVRTALKAMTEMDAAEQIAVQLSASVGWAPADVVGYDLDALLSAARRAVEEASATGGDRWERIRS